MWTVYILVGLTGLLAIRGMLRHDKDDYSINSVSFWKLTVVTIGVMSFVFIISLIIALIIPCKTYMAKHEYKIIALQDNASVEGNFFLGIGSVNGTMKYFMYVDYGDHVKMETLSTSCTKIKYSNKPYLEIQQRSKVPRAFRNNFALLFNDHEEFTIYVPYGTIKQNFTLDAK